jgi:hypothetical protein
VGSNGLIQTAATNIPRFDHDSAGVCRGLLIEESRTNFVLNSDLYSTSTPTNITATTITGTSVTGSSQIRELSLTASGALTGVQANLTGTGTGTKTLSVFIKKPTSNAAPYFTIGFASSALIYAGIQLTMSGSAPVISVTSTSNTFAVVSSSLETFSNDWYRVSVVVSGTATSCFPTMFPSNAVWDGISDIRQTLTASGTNLIYIFGAQMEAGSFATSYIPTTTGTLARGADVCTFTGADFNRFYNSTSGTLLSEAVVANLIGNNRGIVQIDNGTNESILRHLYSSGDGGFRSIIRAGGDTPTVLSTILGTASTIQKRIIAYEGTSFASVTNGGAVATATRTMPTGLNAMKIGNLAEGSFYLSGHIAAIRFYKKRLPNAKIQALTA